MMETEGWQGMMEYSETPRFSLVHTQTDADTHGPCLGSGIARTPRNASVILFSGSAHLL